MLIYGGVGDDYIDGGYGNDIIYGGDGNDTIRNVGDAAVVHCGNGDDNIDYDGGDKLLLYGDEGNDMIRAGAGTKAYGGDGDDTLLAWNGTFLQGDGGNDILTVGGDGNNTFYGGLGTDKITTGGSVDVVQYYTVADSGVSVDKRDVITDFDTSSGDVIELYRLSDKPLTYLSAKVFDGTKGAVRLDIDTKNQQTIVQVDMNGDKAPEMEIALTGIKILAADDFMLSAPILVG